MISFSYGVVVQLEWLEKRRTECSIYGQFREINYVMLTEKKDCLLYEHLQSVRVCEIDGRVLDRIKVKVVRLLVIFNAQSLYKSVHLLCEFFYNF